VSADARILAFAGSARSESFNKKLLRIAVRGAEAAGATCICVDLRDYPLPIYDGDLEAESGLPENARKLRALFASHAGLLIASPEHNSSIPALLKNTLDWVSRSESAAPDLSVFSGKIACVMAASPSPLGGMRGLVHLSAILGNMGCIVLPGPFTLRQAMKAFDAQGELLDEKYGQRVAAQGAQLADWVRRAAQEI